MEFVDLKAQQSRIENALRARIDSVLAHGHYIMGPEVRELEQRLAHFTGASHVYTCASGTDALLLPLMAWGIGPGHAVFVPAFTFFATAEMPALLGATPVFVDVEPVTRNMGAESLEKAIARVRREGVLKPGAVIPVGLFGQLPNMKAILQAANGIPVLEDSAQCFGATHSGLRACNTGADVAATSFFPAKPLGCYGDGGAMFTNNDELAARLDSLRIHGKGKDKYDNRHIGINGRMDTLQAAILLPKLDIFPQELMARQQVANWYKAALPSRLERPVLPAGTTSSWAQYTVLLPDTEDASARRDAVQQALVQLHIPTQVYYPTPQHCLTVFAHLGYRPEDLPVSLNLSRRILALPMHPYLAQNEVECVCGALQDAL